MKAFKEIKINVEVISDRSIIVFFNFSLFLEPSIYVHNKLVSVLHDIDTLEEGSQNVDLEQDDNESDIYCEYDYRDVYDECESVIELVSSIKGIDSINFSRHQIAICKGGTFFKWEDIMKELMDILILQYGKGAMTAKLHNVKFMPKAKKEIGEKNLESFIKNFPKKYELFFTK